MSRTGFIKKLSDRLKERHATLWQFLSFYLLGGVSMTIDLTVFSLCNYVIFKRLSGEEFRWWIFDYYAENGGLCAFISFAISFAAAQTVNFFLQRKATFRANNNALLSGVMYAVMVVSIYLFVLWLPSVVGEPVYAAFGAAAGATALKLISEFLSAMIQFPINKWVIMRKK